MASPSRAVRVVVGVAQALGLAVVFLASAAAGVLLHLNLPAPRRFATARVNAVLEGTFKGRVVIERAGTLHLTHLGGIDAHVLDPEGRTVLRLSGVDVRLRPYPLVRSLASRSSTVVRLPAIDVGDVEAVVEDDASGEIGLVRAFDTRGPAAGGAGTDVSIGRLHVRHAWVHGHLASIPVIDADLDDLSGALRSTPETTDVDVEHLAVRARGIPGLSPEGTVVAHATLPADPDGAKHARLQYDGRAGEIPLHLHGSLDDKTVTAVVDVPETAPSAVVAIAPGSIHLRAPVSAHGEVDGELPTLQPRLHLEIGGGTIAVSATVRVPGKQDTALTADVKVDVKDLDASVVDDGAPASALSAHAAASVFSRPGGELSGDFHLETEVGRVAGQVVPAIDAQGSFTQASVDGEARIAEQGAPTRVVFSLHPREGGTSPKLVRVSADTDVPDLEAFPRAGHIGFGRAHAHVDARADLDAKRLEADATVDGSGLLLKGVGLAQAHVRASAEGPFASPRFRVRIVGADVRAGGYLFRDLDARASGTKERSAVALDLTGSARAPSVAVRARVESDGELAVRGATIGVDRGDAHLRARIPSVRVSGGTLDIRGAVIEGLGEAIEATARISSGAIAVEAKAPDIDSSRLARLVAREEDARGHLAFSVDATARRQGVRGSIMVDARDLSARGLRGASAHLSTSGDGTRMRGDLTVSLGDAGKLSISALDVTPRGAVVDPAAWKKATGSIAIDGSADIGQLLGRVLTASRVVDAGAGTVAITCKVARRSPSESPDIDLRASTKGLLLVGTQEVHKNADGSIAYGPDPWHTAGVDGSIAVKIGQASDRVEVSAELHDVHGGLVTVTANGRLPLATVIKAPNGLLGALRDAPIEAKLTVPRRSLDALPSAIGAVPFAGHVELTADLRGTARAPKLTMDAKATDLTPHTSATCQRPLDAEARVTYDGEKADLRLAATRDARDVLTTSGTVTASAARAMATGALAWEASGELALDGFPLETLGALVEEPIAGKVSGKVKLADLHRAASLDADLDLRGLKIDRADFTKGKVKLILRDGKLATSARLDASDGFGEVGATGTMKWGAAVAPQLDATKAVDLTLRAKNFRAAAAAPFVQGTFSELDGRLDTDAKLHVEPGFKDGKMTGDIALHDVVFEVPQIGERFHAVKAKVTMKPWGMIRVDELSGEGPTGKLTASAQAELRGLSLRSATAKLHIDKGKGVPVALEGVPMGRVYGDVTTKATMAPDGTRVDVDVDVPKLHVDLPQSTGHTVQPLEPDKTVRIGVRRGRDLLALPLAPPATAPQPSSLLVHAAVKLGEVEVKRDTTVNVTVRGHTAVDVGEKARVSGQIHLDHGKLELEGKQFVIDHGTVSFVGPDPADPQIVATAYWDAPDGTRVFADFSGRVTSGKLELRSEPSMTQDEILSMILFGSSTGSFGAEAPPGQQESGGIKAAGVAGSVVTEGVNKAISGVTSADVTTRVDTSNADSPRPELAVQVAKGVSARLGYKLGVPAPGENRTELTVDWRFIRNWSLVTVVGDQGSTALDLEWRIRY